MSLFSNFNIETEGSKASGGSNSGYQIGKAVGGIFGEGVGNLVGGVGSMIGGLFDGGGTPMGSTQFDGLHNPNFPQIQASSLKEGEVRVLEGYAKGLGISVEEVDALMKVDAAQTGHSDAYVMDAWRNDYKPMLDNARIYLRRYNQMHPNAPIIEGSIYARGGGNTVVSGSQSYPLFPQTVSQNTGQSPAQTGFIAQPGSQAPSTNNTASSSNSTTYAMIGGGALVLIVLILVLLKK